MIVPKPDATAHSARTIKGKCNPRSGVKSIRLATSNGIEADHRDMIRHHQWRILFLPLD